MTGMCYFTEYNFNAGKGIKDYSDPVIPNSENPGKEGW